MPEEYHRKPSDMLTIHILGRCWTIKIPHPFCMILGDIPDMGKARFVKMKDSIKELEVEAIIGEEVKDVRVSDGRTAIVKLIFDEDMNEERLKLSLRL